MWGYYYWPSWLSVVSLTFLPAELFALFTNHANTLSDYAWHELNVTKALTFSMHGIAWWSSLISVTLVFVILVFHIWFRVTL